MFSFRSISLVAAFAFAAFSFASPVENVGALDLRTVPVPAVHPGHVSEVIPRGQLGIPDHLDICHGTLLDLKVEIVAALDGIVDIEVVVGLLGKVGIAIEVLVGSLNGFIGTGAEVYCLSGGVVVGLQSIAAAVLVLLQLVLDILCLVVDLCVHVEIKVVVSHIVVLLSTVVQLVLKIVIGLLPFLIEIVGSLLVDIHVLLGLNIGALLDICGLLQLTIVL
jgi:hypothetical protein